MKFLLQLFLLTLLSQMLSAQTPTNTVRVSGSYLMVKDAVKSYNFYGGNFGLEMAVSKYATLGLNVGYHEGSTFEGKVSLATSLFNFSPELKYYFRGLYDEFYIGIAFPSFNKIKATPPRNYTLSKPVNELVGISTSVGVVFWDNASNYAALSVSYGRLSEIKVTTQTPISQFSASVILGHKWVKK